MITRAKETGSIRYAVVGLGYIAQMAVLPAFAHARKNSELGALISDDPRKLRALRKKYKVRHSCSYSEYDDFLRSGNIDAVYIALPNSLHCEYAIRAAKAGIHILCEKPLAASAYECQKMMLAASTHHVKLMTAYRLHFEESNLDAVKLLQSGKIGEPRVFNSIFSQQVKSGDIRLRKDLGGGTLYDMGIYCINAARYLFRAEPEEVFAFSEKGLDLRFREVDEMTSAILRFPGGRLASFTSSFGAATNSWYEVVGTKGNLRMMGAYDLAAKRYQEVEINGKTRGRAYPIQDQFAPELLAFSDCILNDDQLEPSGKEGLIDVSIIEALYQSAETGCPVSVRGLHKNTRPSPVQRITRPKVKEPELVHASAPSRD